MKTIFSLLALFCIVIAGSQTAEAKRFDSDTGLYTFKYRHYSPKMGRFLTRDPIAEKGGSLNIYEYSRNDSINNADILGLKVTPKQTHYFPDAFSAATHAGTRAKTMSEAWDKKNSNEIDRIKELTLEEFGSTFRIEMEHGGHICELKTPCSVSWEKHPTLGHEIPIYDSGSTIYSYTGPTLGLTPQEVFDFNKRRLEQWEQEKKEAEEYNKVNAIPKAIPVKPGLAGGAYNWGTSPQCSTLGEGWKLYGYYHSHPSNLSFSDQDKMVGQNSALPIFVTYGTYGSASDTWTTEAYYPPSYYDKN